MKIAIRFGDNDFSTTFNFIMRNIIAHLQFEPTKEQVVEIVNEVSFGVYLAIQREYRYEDDSDSTRKWIKIETKDVFLNKEVDEIAKKYTSGDEGFYIYDGDVFGGYTYTL